MPYQTTKPIKSLSAGGVNLRARQYVTPAAFTSPLWQALLDEGAVVEVPNVPLPGQVEPDETAVLPTAPTPYDAMDLEELKAEADMKGITYGHNIRESTLRERLKNASD